MEVGHRSPHVDLRVAGQARADRRGIAWRLRRTVEGELCRVPSGDYARPGQVDQEGRRPAVRDSTGGRGGAQGGDGHRLILSVSSGSATIKLLSPMLRFETAGESHGECLVATLAGLPAGIPISLEAVNRELWRRQQGYGRGGRMRIETDRAEIVAGVRHSHTIGSPVAILIRNKDWQNWTAALPVEDAEGAFDGRRPVTRPRPGHADLAGAIKYDFHDARYILERASARETAARVAIGALAKALLGQFGVEILSHVVAVSEERRVGKECR